MASVQFNRILIYCKVQCTVTCHSFVSLGFMWEEQLLNVCSCTFISSKSNLQFSFSVYLAARLGQSRVTSVSCCKKQPLHMKRGSKRKEVKIQKFFQDLDQVSVTSQTLIMQCKGLQSSLGSKLPKPYNAYPLAS